MFNIFKKKKTRRIIIGLDGVPYPMIQKLISDGTMPNLADIVKESKLSKMRSSIPHISSVAWSSIVTGKNPGEHGIFGFMELKPGTYDFSFPNSFDVKAPPFWENKGLGRSVIINVPSTYPAKEMNGVLIAGFVALDLGKATYPSSFVPKLKEFDYRTDVDSSKGHSSTDDLIEDAFDTLEARAKTYRYLWDNEKWDTFMLTITGTDRFCHFLYEAFEKEDHMYRSSFLKYFTEVDSIIGEIYGKISEKDHFLMLSDHGFGHMDTEVYLNRVLIENGFLKLDTDEPKSFDAIAEGTKAFVLDPSRVYVHTEDRYTRGEVFSADKENVLKELETLFKDFEINGRKVIKDIYRKDDIFNGPYVETAPDLVLVENEGFDLKAKLGAKEISGKTVFTGKHTLDDAFLLVRPPVGKEVSIPEDVTVYDFRAILEGV